MSSTDRLAYAEDGLLTLLQANATLAALVGPPGIGDPSPGTLMPEHVWISEKAETDMVPVLTGRTGVGEREQTFTLHVMCFAQISGGSFVAARNRSRDIAALVETIVLADFTLGSSVREAWPSRIEREGFVADEARGVIQDVSIFCRTWLS